MDFNNQSVLITGASRGIGLACAQAFNALGATVITVQRNPSPEFFTIHADLNDPEQAESIIKQAIAHAGRLDVLVNNAGVMVEAHTQKTTLSQWQQTLTTNLTTPFFLAQHAMPYLKTSQGAIVNISSIEGLGSNPNHAAYCASKSGLHGMTRAIAVDCGADGVRCNAVAPGWIDTELNEQMIEAMPDPQAFRRAIGTIHPLNRTGSPAEIAHVVCFLASKHASFITGQIYTVDGGRMAKLSLP